jgi:hypothetical protein
VGAEISVTSCDLGVFVDQSAKPVSSQDPHIRAFCERIDSSRWWVLVQRPVWPMGVVVIGVLAEDEPQMPLAGDQHLIEAFAAGAADPTFGDRVRARRLHGCFDEPDSGGREHGVEGRGELGVPVMGGVLDEEQTYRRRRKTVSTWKKSAANIVRAWVARNARHGRPRRSGAGSMPASLRIFQTVDGATAYPRPVSSP